MEKQRQKLLVWDPPDPEAEAEHLIKEGEWEMIGQYYYTPPVNADLVEVQHRKDPAAFKLYLERSIENSALFYEDHADSCRGLMNDLVRERIPQYGWTVTGAETSWFPRKDHEDLCEAFINEVVAKDQTRFNGFESIQVDGYPLREGQPADTHLDIMVDHKWYSLAPRSEVEALVDDALSLGIDLERCEWDDYGQLLIDGAGVGFLFPIEYVGDAPKPDPNTPVLYTARGTCDPWLPSAVFWDFDIEDSSAFPPPGYYRLFKSLEDAIAYHLTSDKGRTMEGHLIAKARHLYEVLCPAEEGRPDWEGTDEETRTWFILRAGWFLTDFKRLHGASPETPYAT